jgi:hypothetical protein
MPFKQVEILWQVKLGHNANAWVAFDNAADPYKWLAMWD